MAIMVPQVFNSTGCMLHILSDDNGSWQGLLQGLQCR